MHDDRSGDAEHQKYGQSDAHLRPGQCADGGLHFGQVHGHGDQFALTAAHRHGAPLRLRPVHGADGHRFGADVVVGRQGRLGVAVVDRHPLAAVGADAAHVEVRRGATGVRSFDGRLGQPPWRLGPAARRVHQGLIDAVDEAVAQDRRDSDARGEQAEADEHQHRGHQADPKGDTASTLYGHGRYCRRLSRFAEHVPHPAQSVQQPLLASVDLAAKV